MESAEHEFGVAQDIDAEAIGQPGQRRFRLLVRSETQTAAIWMEKQELDGIGTWLEESLVRIKKDKPGPDEPEPVPEPFGEVFNLTLQARQIGLGYVEGDNLFAVLVTSDESTSASTPTFRCQFRPAQARVLRAKIAAVVAAGRPICPLCEAPMDPSGHVCPRSNGHLTHLST
jgi:uncharacterized repeat protein (TIGR03847 family)